MSKRRPGSQQRSTSSLSTNEARNSKKVLDENYDDNDKIEFRAEGEPTRESLSSLEFRSEPKYVEEPLFPSIAFYSNRTIIDCQFAQKDFEPDTEGMY